MELVSVSKKEKGKMGGVSKPAWRQWAKGRGIIRPDRWRIVPKRWTIVRPKKRELFFIQNPNGPGQTPALPQLTQTGKPRFPGKGLNLPAQAKGRPLVRERPLPCYFNINS